VISAVGDPRSAIRSPLLAIALVAALASTADAQTDSVRALLQVARRQASEGSAAAALDTLRKARARAPNAEDVLSAYAQMAIASRQPIVAVEVLEPLARMCPSVPQYQYMLGVAYMQAGAILASVDALRAAEALDPGNAALGIALNTRKLHGEAQPVLARSIEIEPENVEAIAALAEAEEGLGDPLAETHAMRALAMNPAHATANYVLGVVRMRQQKYDEARDALLKAIASDQQMARAHYQVSLAYSRLGDEAQARVHVELYQQQMQALEDAAKKLRR
jgi:tetratricopeptide (TPR) repeat protein